MFLAIPPGIARSHICKRADLIGEYPSLKPEDLQQGDLAPNYDFRGFYSSVIDKWLGLDPVPIVGGTFEQLAFV